MAVNKSIDNSVIRIGIDLGTTNSEVAICADDDIEIVKCNENIDYTPSVYGFDKGNNEIVGHRAYSRLNSPTEDDIDNIKVEVKRLMGTNNKVNFSRVNKKMLPEEVSAKILKSLRNDVIRKNSDINTKSAVITVPAYFDSVQNEATMRAGKLAGFDQVILLQEPIAAAMAYGFKKTIDANWLVYDLGGGTFDVALISSNDGMLRVVEQGGDNYLGGKDIDKAIVEQVIKPKLSEKYSISTYTRVREAQLKYCAEQAKKSLTNSRVTTIDIENIGVDDNGEEIYVSFDFTRERLNELIAPTIDKTIQIMREVIERSSIKASSISKIILVGGPTQIPYLRERLAEEMRIDIDTSVDPLTTVARGACIYGMGQRVDSEIRNSEIDEKVGSTDAYKVELNYEAMTSSDTEVVSGIVKNLPESGEYYIRINAESGAYNSATIPLKKNGGFYDSLLVEPGKANRYWIYLTDSDGNNLPIYPDSFTITHGLTVRGIPIPHSIGVIYGKRNERSGELVEACDEFFERGHILPCKEMSKSYVTLRALQKNISNVLPIEVYEGDYSEPRSNRIITKVSIEGSELPHDLPKNTELELTIGVSEAREVSVEVYIPSIDKEFNARAQIRTEDIKNSDIRRDIKKENERLDDADISESEKNEIKRELAAVERSVVDDDTDSKQKASREIDRIRDRISRISNESKKDGLIRRFEEKCKETKDIIDEFKKDDADEAIEKEGIYDDVVKKGHRAIKEKDYDELENQIEQLDEIARGALMRMPAFWTTMLYRLRSEPISSFSDEHRARNLLAEANNAVNSRDIDTLRQSCIELLNMLPRDEQDDISDIQAGITR